MEVVEEALALTVDPQGGKETTGEAQGEGEGYDEVYFLFFYFPAHSGSPFRISHLLLHLRKFSILCGDRRGVFGTIFSFLSFLSPPL